MKPTKEAEEKSPNLLRFLTSFYSVRNDDLYTAVEVCDATKPLHAQQLVT